jgi:hypothetical protein
MVGFEKCYGFVGKSIIRLSEADPAVNPYYCTVRVTLVVRDTGPNVPVIVRL